MSASKQRKLAVDDSLAQIRTSLGDGVSVDSLNAAKQHLMALAERVELFPRSDFPLPEGDATDRTFLIHKDDDGGYALYVNSGVKGQLSRPHDHGDSWAIVAAVEGVERHYLYQRGTVPGSLEQKGHLDVQPGAAISLLPGGIHQVHAQTDSPLLHLHLYGQAFELQKTRTDFDLETGETIGFNDEVWSYVEDAR